MTTRRFRSPLTLFAGFWIIGIVVMVRSYYGNPHDPTLTGTDAYGHTQLGELARILRITAVEVLVFLLLLRPWSYQRSWMRALAGVVLLTPWLLLWGALGLHAGPTTHAHTSWLLLFWLGLTVSGIVSGVGAARARHESRVAVV